MFPLYVRVCLCVCVFVYVCECVSTCVGAMIRVKIYRDIIFPINDFFIDDV